MHIVSQLLKSHDWFYEMSDDHRYWVKGSEEDTKLRIEARKIKDLPWSERKQIAKDAGTLYKYLNDAQVGNFYRTIFKEFMSPEEMNEIAAE